MSRFRFSIAGFFVVLTLVAFGLAATVSQSELAGSAAYTLFLSILCLSIAGAALRPMPARAFWLGFALFGWMYFLVEFETEVPVPQQTNLTRSLFLLSGASSTSSSQPSGRPRLITRHLLTFIGDNITPSRDVGARVIAQWRGGAYYSGVITEADGEQYLIVWDDGSSPQWTPTTQILPSSPSMLVGGHSLCGGLFALLGGILAAVLFSGTAIPARPSTPTRSVSEG